MGMPASLLLRGEGLDEVDDVVASAYAELRRADQVFSTYAVDSDLSRIRRGELLARDADPAVAEVLALCELGRQRTEGWFHVDLPGGLDPSGLVKGWAIERALAVLAPLSEVDVCLNVAGDVAALVDARRAPFTVGIEDPHDRGRLMASVPLASGGLATSGTAARGEHIIDPHTGRTTADVASVSVVGPSLLWADVFATAAFARGRDSVRWLTGVPSYEGLVVHLDGTAETTPGWPGRWLSRGVTAPVAERSASG